MLPRADAKFFVVSFGAAAVNKFTFELLFLNLNASIQIKVLEYRSSTFDTHELTTS